MRCWQFLGWMGVLIVMASSVAFGWGVWPVERFSRQALLTLPAGGAAGETYKIELAGPTRLRRGDAGVIRMALESGDTDPVGGSGDNRLVESRLEAAVFNSLPGGSILEPLLPGRQAVYYWSVIPKQTGDHELVIWVSIHPQAGDSSISSDQLSSQDQLLTAQKIPIQVSGMLGLNGLQARWLGGSGIVIGLGLCLSGFYIFQKTARTS